MIFVDQLTKRFGEHAAVQSVSFAVRTGETIGLLGPNGAGKTTIMRMMTGYLPPTEGRVVINDMDMFDQPDEVKKRIGYLPEQPPVYHDMTVREYLEFAGEIRGVKKSHLSENITRVAGLCGIGDKLGRLIGNLSKGYRQRVGLAQALVHDPDILILDEPTVGLDPKQIIEIRELIRRLGRDRTVILSSHILQEITSLCTKIVIINAGKLVVFDTIDRLSSIMGGSQRVLITVARPEKVDIAAIRSVPGVQDVIRRPENVFEVVAVPGADIREQVAVILARSDAGMLELRQAASSLEEIYLNAVAGSGQ